MQAIIYKSVLPDYTKALCKLIETIWLRSNKVIIYCQDALKLQKMDEVLWSYEQLSFLPHVLDNDNIAPSTPVVLTSNERNINNANIIVCLEPNMPNFAGSFEKLIYMYGNAAENESEKASAFIEQLTQSGIEVTQYQQEASGSWKKFE